MSLIYITGNEPLWDEERHHFTNDSRVLVRLTNGTEVHEYWVLDD